MSHKNEYIGIMRKLAIPVVLQNLIGAMLNLIDSFMVGGLGETALVAIGIANQIFFVINIVVFGLCSGFSVFVAQYWGAKRYDDIKRTVSLGVLMSALLTSVFAILTFVFPELIMRLFTADNEVIQTGVPFLRIVAPGYILMGISMIFAISLRSIEMPKYALVSSSISLAVSTFLNYVLIYGKFGFPSLEVRGSAIATIIARALEVFLIVYIVYKKKLPVAVWKKDFLSLRSEFVFNVAKTGMPVLINETMWVCGISVLAAVYGKIGTSEYAAYNIVSSVEKLAFVIIIGIGHSTAVMVGKQIGAGDLTRADKYAKYSLTIAPVLGLAAGLIMVFSRIGVISLYNVSEAARSYAQIVMIISAFSLIFRFLNFTNLIGVLRAGGDAKFVLYIDIGALWMIAVPLTIFSGSFVGLAFPIVYALGTVEEIIKAVLGIMRYKSGRWMNYIGGDFVNT